MTKRVWLVRHASTDWTGQRWCGRTDRRLSGLGVEEALALAARLGPLLPVDAFVRTSPAHRASETARVLARGWSQRGWSQRFEVDEALQEVDFGRVDGLSWTEVERDLPDLAREIAAGSRIDWPGGETRDQVDARIEELVDRIHGASAPLVLVSHAAVLGLLAGRLTRSSAIGRMALAPATTLELRREGRSWHPITGRT